MAPGGRVGATSAQSCQFEHLERFPRAPLPSDDVSVHHLAAVLENSGSLAASVAQGLKSLLRILAAALAPLIELRSHVAAKAGQDAAGDRSKQGRGRDRSPRGVCRRRD